MLKSRLSEKKYKEAGYMVQTLKSEEAARVAELVYVNGEESWWRRKRWGKGFTYQTALGETIVDKSLRERLEGLKIPPAWEEVRICPFEVGHIQAVGRDSKGRKQYIYHEKWREIRTKSKFDGLVDFGKRLPTIRRRVERDLEKERLSYEQIMATLVWLLDKTLMRVGNEEYERKNESYGLTTLKDWHVEFNGRGMEMEFEGKSGVEQEVGVRNRRIARIVRDSQEIPGESLFQYYDTEGRRREIKSEDVNGYLKSAAGEQVTSKDFRTWGASHLAAVKLQRKGEGASKRELDERVRETVKEVAEYLGNKPSTTKKYYIHPSVVNAYRNGGLNEYFDRQRKDEGDNYLRESEEALLEMIEEKPVEV